MILFLGSETSPLFAWLKEREEVIQAEERITSALILANDISHIVSYGYRHIIKPDVLDAVSGRAVNLHISFLPWNRGADPNFWSFLQGTPKGVTIHFIDPGLDTGDIIAQQRIEFEGTETLASTYRVLQDAVQELFRTHWNRIRFGPCPRMLQRGPGTFHKSADKEPFLYLLTDGWDTKVSVLQDFAKGTRLSPSISACGLRQEV